MAQWQDIISEYLSSHTTYQVTFLEELVESRITNAEETEELTRTAAIFELINILLISCLHDGSESGDLRAIVNDCFIKLMASVDDDDFNTVKELVRDLTEELTELLNGPISLQQSPILLTSALKLSLKESQRVQSFILCLMNEISQQSVRSKMFIGNVPNFFDLLLEYLPNFSADSPLFNVINTLMEIATVSSSSLVSLFKPLLTSNNYHIKYLSSISHLMNKQRSSFYHLNRTDFPITLESKSPVPSYTLQLWFQLNSPDTDATILSINSKITIRIQSCKLTVYYKDIRIDTIESFQIQENQIYHLVLIHEDRSVTFDAPRLRVYINTQYCQTLKCPYPIENDQGFSSKLTPSEVSLKLGSSAVELEAYNCLMVSGSLSHEWLVLSYYLGKSYSNIFQDSNILRFLDYEERSFFNLSLLSLSKSTEIPFDSDNLDLTVNKQNVLFNLNPSFLESIGVKVTNGSLVSSNISSVTYYESRDISELLYALSPFPPIFQAIESSKDLDTLFQATETILKLASSNWKLIEEFETMSGYQILSTILKVKKVELKTNLNKKFLDLFLKYNGYDFSAPYNSVIINPSFYDNVILDFQLWRPLSSKIVLLPAEQKRDGIELLKFLIHQINVFTHDCVNSSYNILKLKKINLVARFLNCISQNFFPVEICDSIQGCLSNLVEANLTPKVVRSLSGFVIYSLSEGQSCYATVVLNVLARVFLDPLMANPTYWRKLFGSMSLKWILLLIQLSKNERYIIDLALSFLVKAFTVSNKSHEVFLKSNGLHVLLGCLRDAKIDEVEINILIRGSFGHYQHDLDFESLKFPLASRGLDHLLFPSFHYLIIDLLEWTVLNDIFKEDDHRKIIDLINFYLDFVQLGINDIPGFEKSMKMDKNVLRRLCGFVVLLTKPRNAAIYFDPSERVLEVLSGFIMGLISTGTSTEVDSYLTSVISSLENDGSSTVLSAVFLSLVIPKLLIHIKEFSSEFGILLETGSMSFTNFAVFLNSLSGELLTFQWDMKDYFNYMSILLDLLEAYRKCNKNTRSPQYTQLVRNVTQLLNVLLVILNDTESHEQQANFFKIIMFHQENLFGNKYLSNDGCANLVAYLLGITAVESDSAMISLALNCLRIVLMQRQADIGSIASSITFRYYSSLSNFLSSALTLGDEDLVSSLTKDSKLVALLHSHLSSLSTKLDRKNPKAVFLPVQTFLAGLSNSQDSAIKKKYEVLDELVKILQNENQILKSKLLTKEGVHLSRFLQDQHDSLQFFISSYNKMKSDNINEMAVLFSLPRPEQRWELDTAEGIDRMRKVLLPHTVVESSDKITNMADFPRTRRLSSIDPESERVRIESLSLNSFEMVDAEAIQEDPVTAYNDKNRRVLKSLRTGDQIVEIWNVSQVVGLEITEGILILGQLHIYLIENYYHNTAEDEIINVFDVPEAKRDPNVKLITGQPRHKTSAQSGSDLNGHLVQTWDLFELTSVTKRQFLLRDVALELFFSDGDSFLITSIQTRERDIIYSKLSNVATNSNIDDDLSKIFKATNAGNAKLNPNANSFTSRLSNVFSPEFSLEATKKWQRGEISNFYYLMIINTLAGRTFNDLTQYPVFPWVIADYTSEELDLSDPKSFRDLSKPMGAQSQARAQQFKDRYDALESLQDEDSPPFHYGTHYSSAMIVVSFLIRLEPFVQSYLLLQGGKFDHADRLFYSIEKAWKSSSAENTTDVRELIPEFFFLPEFLTNINNYDFGKLQDGTKISGVDLPKWAKGDPAIFIAKNRHALESPYVTEHLHEWIDLIFGFKQSGPAAVEAINVFNHLSYHGAIDLDSISNEDERRSITGIIHNFGQTPLQIFSKPHSPRLVEDGAGLEEFCLELDVNILKSIPTMLYQTKFKDPIKFIQFKLHSDNIGDAFWRGYPELHLNGDFEIRTDELESDGMLLINRKCFERLHDEKITTITLLSKDMFLTGSQSGSIHIWKVKINKSFDDVDLKFVRPLRLHTSGIKELRVSPEFNLLLSLDYDGNVHLWNLVDYSFIRSIDTKADTIAISYESGLIGTATGSVVTIFTINGQKIIEEEIDESVTALNFGNSRTVTSFKSPSFPTRHEFWKHETVLVLGTTNGKIHISSLGVDDSWKLEMLKTLVFKEKEKEMESKEITVVECYVKSFIDDNDEKKTRLEVIAGDYNGRVAVWR
ncbi:hypothetical protein WICPIJ_004392 [Wickerhamomyces pijperi]|uniref:Uncharacterized protein n=1 Tax=Wickerhamomyces pijperi TaxID=599730 RepID=A0A9P8TNB9_WICPI|nr:hypothetical protein WICPIJ_004392 [Wickerhamomyces pijperi]